MVSMALILNNINKDLTVVHIEYENSKHGLFEERRVNHCLLHEIEMKFKCRSGCYI